MKFKVALLDIDGTLLDSNDAHARSWQDALAAVGFNVPLQIIRRGIGMGGDHLIPRLTGARSDSELGTKISKRRGQIFREQYLPNLELFDGAVEFLDILRSLGFSLTVATSASPEDSGAITKKYKLDRFIDYMTNSSDAEVSKPEPDIVLAALKKSGVQASQAIMFGDTPYDIEAAVRAGVSIDAFATGCWSVSELCGAKRVFGGARDLVTQLQKSPHQKDFFDYHR